MSYWIHSDPTNPDTDDGLRPCALEGRCAERDHQGQPKPGPRNFCSSDRDLIARSLAWLPTAWVMLHQMLGDKGTGGQGEKVSSTPTPSAPYNFEVDALMTDMTGLLGDWADRVRDVAQLYQAPAQQRDAVVVEAAVKTLSAHLNVLLALLPAPMERFLTLDEAANLNAWATLPTEGDRRHKPELDGTVAGIEVLHLHRRARNMLGLNPRHVDLPVPCWNEDCGLRTVRRWDGAAGLDDEASCTSCGERYTHDRYILLIRQVEEQQRAKNNGRKAS